MKNYFLNYPYIEFLMKDGNYCQIYFKKPMYDAGFNLLQEIFKHEPVMAVICPSEQKLNENVRQILDK